MRCIIYCVKAMAAIKLFVIVIRKYYKLIMFLWLICGNIDKECLRINMIIKIGIYDRKTIFSIRKFYTHFTP